MRAETVVRVTTACGLALAMAAPALAQDVRVQVKIDPAVVQEIKDIIRDASRSDMGREIGDAVRDAVRETTRALPEVSALMPSGGWQDRNFRAEQKDSQTKTAAIGANGSLDLKNVSGDVIVNAGGGRDATIEIVRVSHGRTDADAKTGLDRVHVDVTTRSDRTTVEAVYPSENRPPYSVSINYTVTAPAGTRVNVSSVSGDVSVKGITGDVAVSVISGGIRLDNANVSSATTISGDVTGTHLSTTGAMTISSVSGTTTLTQIKCKRLSASVVSGDVIARDVTCDNAELKNISGDVRVLRRAHPRRALRVADALRRRETDGEWIGGVRSSGEHVFRADPAGAAAATSERQHLAPLRPRHGRRRRSRRDRDRVQRRRRDRQEVASVR